MQPTALRTLKSYKKRGVHRKTASVRWHKGGPIETEHLQGEFRRAPPRIQLIKLFTVGQKTQRRLFKYKTPSFLPSTAAGLTSNLEVQQSNLCTTPSADVHVGQATEIAPKKGNSSALAGRYRQPCARHRSNKTRRQTGIKERNTPRVVGTAKKYFVGFCRC